MQLRAALIAAALVLPAPLAACSSAPADPSWCAPLVQQFHTTMTWSARQSQLTALKNSGAPVGALLVDETRLQKDETAMNSVGTAGFDAAPDAVKAIAKVTADLKTLNAQCGQPADAYKSDDV